MNHLFFDLSNEFWLSDFWPSDFDQVIFDRVIFDKVIFDWVIFDKVIFDRVSFDWVIFDLVIFYRVFLYKVIFDWASDSQLLTMLMTSFSHTVVKFCLISTFWDVSYLKKQLKKKQKHFSSNLRNVQTQHFHPNLKIVKKHTQVENNLIIFELLWYYEYKHTIIVNKILRKVWSH